MSQDPRRVSAAAPYQGNKPGFKPAPGAAKPKARRQLDAHEHILLASRRNNTAIAISMMNGDMHIGVVCDFDRYSFTVRLSDGEELCMFKHAIASFKSPRPA